MDIPLEGCSDMSEVSAAVPEKGSLMEMSGEAAEAGRERAEI